MFEFMDYVATPAEKHHGIVRIKAFGKIVLRYKIMPKKDGSGWFPICASYKIPGPEGDSYVSAFVLDSNSDKEDVEALIRANVKRHIVSVHAPLPELAAQSKVTDLENMVEELPF